jgi:hypothetical protein
MWARRLTCSISSPNTDRLVWSFPVSIFVALSFKVLTEGKQISRSFVSCFSTSESMTCLFFFLSFDEWVYDVSDLLEPLSRRSHAHSPLRTPYLYKAPLKDWWANKSSKLMKSPRTLSRQILKINSEKCEEQCRVEDSNSGGQVPPGETLRWRVS